MKNKKPLIIAGVVAAAAVLYVATRPRVSQYIPEEIVNQTVANAVSDNQKRKNQIKNLEGKIVNKAGTPTMYEVIGGKLDRIPNPEEMGKRMLMKYGSFEWKYTTLDVPTFNFLFG